MARTTVEDTKVCRICAAVAPPHQERCPNCNSVNWGPIPRQLAWTVQPGAGKGAKTPPRLAGYRGFDSPPVPSHAQVGDLPSVPRKDPEFAAMMASLTGVVGIWGIGHIYVGKRVTGILLLLSGAAMWGTYVALNYLGKGPLFWVFGVVVWALLIAWAYGDTKERPAGWKRLIPGIAIAWTVLALWWQVEIVYIFIALGLTNWIFLTTRAYNLAVEYNDHRDQEGSSPW